MYLSLHGAWALSIGFLSLAKNRSMYAEVSENITFVTMSNLLKVVVLLGMCSSYFHECLAVPQLTGGQAYHKRCQESA